MTILGVAVVVVAVGGFPSWAREWLLAICGMTIAVLAYLSSVTYCSNCKKLIEDAELALPSDTSEKQVVVPKKIQ